MKTRGRVDGNQRDIVTALRKAGCSVFITSSIGGGFPDIVVGVDGVNWLIEIKDGSLSPSRRKLTHDEETFHLWWNGLVETVESVDEALELILGIS